MKTLKYKVGEIEIMLTVSHKNYEWVRLLFARNGEPFKALRDLGFDAEK